MAATHVIVNPEMPRAVLEALHSEGFSLLFLPVSDSVAPPLKGHPDLQLFIHERHFFCHPGLLTSFTDTLKKMGEVTRCTSETGPAYPDDISYNVACTGTVAFHRSDRTDPDIRGYLAEKNIPLLTVSQGYSKCSTCIAGPGHIITADVGIHQAALKGGIESLLVNPGHVELPGYRYGFLGGASGLWQGRLYFAGHLRHHPDYRTIEAFLSQGGIEPVYLSDGPLFDGGSLFFI